MAQAQSSVFDRDIDEVWDDVDFNKYKPPFRSELLEQALDWPPKGAPDPLTTSELLAWLESDSVLASLKQWHIHVLDREDQLKQVQPGFSLNSRHTSDTIDCLTMLCARASEHREPSPSDAWEATAYFAAKLADASDIKGSPLQGMKAKGELHWCYDVAVRVLITVYCDLAKAQATYFSTLLGCQKLKAPRVKDMRRIIDNRPIDKDSEMDGVYGYRAVSPDSDE